MGYRCCIPDCKSNFEKKYTPAFRFPSAPDKCQLWINSINRQNFKPNSTSVVCVKHFEEHFIVREDKVIRDDGTLLVVKRRKLALTSEAFPTIFENQPKTMSTEETAQWQKQLSMQSQAEFTTESRVSHLTDVVQETSSIQYSNTPQAVLNNDILTLPLVFSIDTIQRSGVSPIQGSNISNVQSSSSNHVILKDSPCTSSLPVTSKKYVPIIPKKVKTTCVASTQVNLDSSYRGNYAGKIMYCSKETQTEKSSKKIPIHGRRIIDFDYFFSALKRVNNHSRFSCNLNDIVIEREKKFGICSRYFLRCTQCNFFKAIWSENLAKRQNLNTDLVSAMLNMKCSLKAMNEIFSTMHLPLLSNSQFIKECSKINKKTLKKVAKNNTISSIHSMQKDIASDGDKISEQAEFSDLLIEDQFEVKEENILETENESEIIIPDKMIVDSEHLTFNPAIVKQEIESDLDDDEMIDCTVNKNETLSNENLIKNEQAEIILPQQGKTNIFMNKIIDNQTNTNLHKNATVQNFQGNNKSVKFESRKMKTSDNESATNFHNQSKTELCLAYENRLDKDKLSNLTEVEGMLAATIPSKEKNFLKQGSVLKGLLTTTSANICSMPIQHITNSNVNNSAVIASQMLPMIAASYQGTNITTFMPQMSTAVQQNANELNSGFLNLTSAVNNFSMPRISQLITFPETYQVQENELK